jgi:hypothetical protein
VDFIGDIDIKLLNDFDDNNNSSIFIGPEVKEEKYIPFLLFLLLCLEIVIMKVIYIQLGRYWKCCLMGGVKVVRMGMLCQRNEKDGRISQTE